MSTPSAQTELFRALADPTRRALSERLCREGEASVSVLTEGAGVSQPVVSKHLAVLARAGLVAGRQAGRNSHYRAQPKALAPLVGWTKRMAGFWKAGSTTSTRSSTGWTGRRARSRHFLHRRRTRPRPPAGKGLAGADRAAPNRRMAGGRRFRAGGRTPLHAPRKLGRGARRGHGRRAASHARLQLGRRRPRHDRDLDLGPDRDRHAAPDGADRFRIGQLRYYGGARAGWPRHLDALERLLGTSDHHPPQEDTNP